jgi:hypothetical protein
LLRAYALAFFPTLKTFNDISITNQHKIFSERICKPIKNKIKTINSCSADNNINNNMIDENENYELNKTFLKKLDNNIEKTSNNFVKNLNLNCFRNKMLIYNDKKFIESDKTDQIEEFFKNKNLEIINELQQKKKFEIFFDEAIKKIISESLQSILQKKY